MYPRTHLEPFTHRVTYKHAHARPHTRCPPRFLQEQRDREGGREKSGHCRDPSPATSPTRSCQREEVGPGWGRGRQTSPRPSFPLLSQACLTSLPQRHSFRTKLFPLSLPRQHLPSPLPPPSAAPTTLEPRAFSEASPGRGSGGCTPCRKGGRGLASTRRGPQGRMREGAGREPERREPGSGTSASFSLVSGRRAWGRALTLIGVEGRRMTANSGASQEATVL